MGVSPGSALPELTVPHFDRIDLLDPLDHLVPVALRRTEDGGPLRQATAVRLARSPAALHVRFHCVDDRPWGTLVRRDDPLWQEEAVELFLAVGEADPVEYVEVEVNPLGALFDARVRNPGLERAPLQVDTSFDWPGIAWRAGAAENGWWAALALPWAGLPGAPAAVGPGLVLRGNLYRVDRPAGELPEHGAWSPTWTAPADFHRPRRFGRLVLTA